jgi:predicted GNAT superfamily acetyltransferase
MSHAVLTDAYTIRSLHTLDDLTACCRLQEEVWGAGFSETAPVSILKATRRLGGVVGGAFDAAGELAGFVFGFTGVEDGRLTHWSHMLAVRAGQRDGGLGRRLKAWQRERCVERDVPRMYWTFDPLESRNGWLNLGRLGVVVREYAEDMYGVSESPLHAGLGTDRCVALWLLDSPRVVERLHGRGAPPPSWGDVQDLPHAFPVLRGTGPPRPGPVGPPDGDDAVLVPIPADIHGLKAADPELARAWRVATRAALLPRLAGGWEIQELVRSTEAVSYYLLSLVSGKGSDMEASSHVPVARPEEED